MEAVKFKISLATGLVSGENLLPLLRWCLGTHVVALEVKPVLGKSTFHV